MAGLGSSRENGPIPYSLDAQRPAGGNSPVHHEDEHLEVAPPNDPVRSAALIVIGVLAIAVFGIIFLTLYGLGPLGW